MITKNGILKSSIVALIICLLIVPSALATDHSASGTFSHKSYGDYGLKAFSYNLLYVGNSYTGTSSGSTYIAVNSHDIQCFVSSGLVYPGECGNGQVDIGTVALQNSSGSNLATLGPSSFSSGVLRGYVTHPGDLYLLQQHSNSVLKKSPKQSVRIKVWTNFSLDDSWAPNVFSSDTASTAYFSS